MNEIGVMVLIILCLIFTPLLDIIVIAIIDRCPKWVRGETDEDEIYKESEIRDIDEKKDS